MTPGDPHGDDWIEVLGGVLMGIITLAWGVVTLGIQLIRWLVKKAPSS